MKRVFGKAEIVFDVGYLILALVMGCYLFAFRTPEEIYLIPASMAVILAAGDAWHLIPRILTIVTKDEERYRRALGRGKQITSITMTIFYLFLWRLSEVLYQIPSDEIWTWLIYLLVAVRIVLCLMPQNRWVDRYPPVFWGVMRNIPFFLLGMAVVIRFFYYQTNIAGLQGMWIAVLLSFAFYLPVVLWANKKPAIGMLMLPKTCMYLWILLMLCSI